MTSKFQTVSIIFPSRGNFDPFYPFTPPEHAPRRAKLWILHNSILQFVYRNSRVDYHITTNSKVWSWFAGVILIFDPCPPFWPLGPRERAKYEISIYSFLVWDLLFYLVFTISMHDTKLHLSFWSDMVLFPPPSYPLCVSERGLWWSITIRDCEIFRFYAWIPVNFFFVFIFAYIKLLANEILKNSVENYLCFE